MSDCIILIADSSIDSTPLRNQAAEFGWSLRVATGLSQLRHIAAGERVMAVLFDAAFLNLAPTVALKRVRGACPGALAVICHRFSEAIDWPLLVDAGAFHSIRLPLQETEVKQTLGFVWGAERLRRPQLALAAGRAA